MTARKPKYARVSRRGRWHIVSAVRPGKTIVARCGRAIALKRVRSAESAMEVEDKMLCELCAVAS
jgi:hypothetical protein